MIYHQTCEPKRIHTPESTKESLLSNPISILCGIPGCELLILRSFLTRLESYGIELSLGTLRGKWEEDHQSQTQPENQLCQTSEVEEDPI